nr:putative capsid protein [Cressdnaviricota sp.]
MPYFPRKKMVKRAPKKAKNPRRRAQALPIGPLMATGAFAYRGAKRVYNRRVTVPANKAKNAHKSRLAQSDNITTAKAVVVGKQRTISFQEKVSRTVRPPLNFKRNYSFSAECPSGRKAMFSMRINAMTPEDLNNDLTSYKSSLFSDTGNPDLQVAQQGERDNAQFYVDKLVEKIQMVNSSSNSITGKVHLFAYKRDSGTTYGLTNAIIDPINMLMYYSTQALSTIATGAGNESFPGNGWFFNATGGNSGINYTAIHNMPGSSLNTAGSCGFFDPALTFTSPQVKDGIDFWFRKVSSSDFSLKPGQQLNSSFVFNDLPIINREEQAQYIFINGVSYIAVVEFKAGIVGSTESSDISTGSCQLSVIRENTRTLGMKNTLRSKTVLQTAPLTQIAIASQVIINSDTGVGLSGTVIDS